MAFRTCSSRHASSRFFRLGKDKVGRPTPPQPIARKCEPSFRAARPDKGQILRCHYAANRVKNGTKTGNLGAPVPTEVPCFHNHLAGAQKTAKPLCVGSIPTRASKFPYKIDGLSDLWSFCRISSAFLSCHISCLFVQNIVIYSGGADRSRTGIWA